MDSFSIKLDYIDCYIYIVSYNVQYIKIPIDADSVHENDMILYSIIIRRFIRKSQ